MAASKTLRFKLETAAAGDANHWHHRLLRGRPRAGGEPGAILAHHANVKIALDYAPEWAGVLAFNEFTQKVEALNPTPWGYSGPWSDIQDCRAAQWLQHQSINAGVEVVGATIQATAAERTFHPVREYLDSLAWDGTKRIDGWLNLYLGADPSEYTTAVGARWLISAVARIYQPGCKADHCLILEGRQGLGKSEAMRTLAAPWFTDELADLGTKDASMQAFGVWVLELAELDALTRAEASKIKSFMSRTADRFRPPYGKHVVEVPRQCVFVGTVNHGAYLRDETGGRRFWPVACSCIRLPELKRDKSQLWAEAVVRFREGASWWLDSAEVVREAQEQQAERYEGDAWDELIRAWLEQPSQRYDPTGHPLAPFTSTVESVTVADVLLHAVGKRQDQWTQADKNRVSRSLRLLNWERYRERTGNSLEWRYRRKEA